MRSLIATVVVPTASLLASLSPAVAQSNSGVAGVWASSARECADKEGPNSRTFIGFAEAKTGALYDQYENHCRILDVSPEKAGLALNLSCHEFWEELEARRNARKVRVRLELSRGKLLIDGKPFQRCRS
jgi:hypothetical protein